jgi:hypothetical protein
MFFMVNTANTDHKIKMKNISIKGRHKRNPAAITPKVSG